MISAIRPWTEQDINTYFEGWPLDHGGRAYLRFQTERYVWLMRAVRRIIEESRSRGDTRTVRVLDVGPAYQTELMREWPDVLVDTVGFADTRFPCRAGERHYEFDLNDAQCPERWLQTEPHDLVVMAEVIEHLYTSPKLVLACVASWVRPGGHVIVQTPNAVSLRRRLKLLAGRHPYEMIRDTRANPGHFREYTVEELRAAGQRVGLSTEEATLHNYFGHEGRLGRAYNTVCGVLPTALKDGITIKFCKTASDKGVFGKAR